MPKPNCNRKGCTKIRSEFSLFLSRRRPAHFEGHAFCSDSCLDMHVEYELTEKWHRLLWEKNRRIPRPKIGTILLQSAFITPDQLDEAVNLQRQTQKGRLGDWLLRLGFVEEHQITMALARQYGLPLINLRDSDTRSEAIRMIPGKVAKCSSLLPVGYDDSHDSLRIAVTGPVNFNSQEAVRRMVHKGILTYIGDESAIELLIEQWYELEERDLSNVPTYSSLDELLEIGKGLAATAANQRADNIQAELLEDFFWARLDFGPRSRHLFYRHTTAPLPEREPIPAGQFTLASAGAR